MKKRCWWSSDRMVFRDVFCWGEGAAGVEGSGEEDGGCWGEELNCSAKEEKAR